MDEEPRSATDIATPLMKKGLTPHMKYADDHAVESWWERPNAPGIDWPSAVLLIALLAFVVVMVKV